MKPKAKRTSKAQQRSSQSLAEWEMEEAAASRVAETEAELKILGILAPLDTVTRERVLSASQLLLQAERIIPGILASLAATT